MIIKRVIQKIEIKKITSKTFQIRKESRMASSTIRHVVRNISAKIIIVGAGISGLSAAERLIQNGFNNLIILEASHHLGGRIRTEQFGDGWVEIGAQWIHGEEDNAIYEYAHHHDLLADNQATFELNDELFHSEDGRTMDSSLCEHVCDFVSCILERSDPEVVANFDNVSVEDYVDDMFKKELAQSNCNEAVILKKALLKWYKKFQCSIEACNSLSEISLRSFASYRECKGNPLTNLKRGYSSVIKSILKCIPESCIHLDKAVDCIQLMASGSNSVCNVICSDGSSFTGDHVIVTVSLGVLKQHADTMFEPQLPLEKKEVIQKMGFGAVDKIFLEFERSFWSQDAAGYSLVWIDEDDDELQMVNRISNSWSKAIFGFYTVPFASNVLCGWISGVEARYMETLSDEEVCDHCIRLLKRFTGKADLPKVTKMIRSDWYSNPYMVGSYSYHKNDLHEEANDILAKPIYISKDQKEYPAILFAGEATHHHYYSTVHGARETGIREAERIVNFHVKTPPLPRL